VKEHGFQLDRALNFGLLPGLFFAVDPDDALASYVTRYLTEEVAAEGLSRNIPAFARFLQVAALSNARLINASSIGNDAQVARQTVQSYFQILRDTLLGYDLEPFSGTVRRKPIATPKFYFFDTGVVRMLRKLPPVTPAHAEYGEFFEHFLFLELKAWVDYRSPRSSLRFWRSTSGFEVDFILDEQFGIEVKATQRVTEKHLRGLRALSEERRFKRLFLVCMEPRPRRVDGIDVMPWQMFLDELWVKGL
jgi:predicted AAA+ superfamily ATPase